MTKKLVKNSLKIKNVARNPRFAETVRIMAPKQQLRRRIKEALEVLSKVKRCENGQYLIASALITPRLEIGELNGHRGGLSAPLWLSA
jgi:hypothetical protein